MSRAVASVVKRSLLLSGHYSRRLRGDSFPGVAVLCYHGVRADDWPRGSMTFEGLHVRTNELEAHCRLIRETCHPINVAQWRAALAGGPPLPARPVLVTFDDGYRTVFTLARPILERYAVPAVVFVCSDPVEQRRLLWYDAVARRRGEAEVERIKTRPFGEWEAAAAAASQPADDGDPNAPLTLAELKTLADVPGIEIGGHTAAHAILARGSREEQRVQILRNRLSLEACTGQRVRAFAYPNGRPAVDYTPETVELVEASGFDFAFSAHHGFATSKEGPLERSRFLMLAGVSAAELAHRLSYSWRG
jgi:peptidoglycan/xylan/chitin deacetylase (PgdA/CDA1 family)